MDAEASDGSLAGQAANGDDRAFELLVRRHKEPLYRLLRRYTGNPDEAYEALHEAFISAWRALHRYDPKRPFGAWLRTIAINKARDRSRRMAVRRFIFGGHSLEDGNAMIAVDPGTPADQALVDQQRAVLLDAAISRLPVALKEALLLTAFEDYSHQDAGGILGVSAKTIEMRVYRARKLLREKLRQVGDFHEL